MLLEKKYNLPFNDAENISAFRVNQKFSEKQKHILITLRDNQVKSKL